MTEWMFIRLLCDFLCICREISVIIVFKYASKPQAWDVVLHLIQVLVLWAFTTGWAIYGAKLFNDPFWQGCTDPNMRDVFKVCYIALAQDFFVVFLFIMISPGVIRYCLTILYTRFYMIMFERYTKKV